MSGLLFLARTHAAGVTSKSVFDLRQPTQAAQYSPGFFVRHDIYKSILANRSSSSLMALTAVDNAGDYRSAATGDWNVNATWETFDGANWIAATEPPSNADGVITIRSAHTVSMTAAATYDQVVVESGGQVTVASGVAHTLANGVGTDLTINGTWLNQGGTWTTSGTWTVGSGGTFIQNSTTAGFGTNLNNGTLDAASSFVYRGSAGNVPSSSFAGANVRQFIVREHFW